MLWIATSKEWMAPKSVGEFVTYSTDSSGSGGVVHVLAAQ